MNLSTTKASLPHASLSRMYVNCLVFGRSQCEETRTKPMTLEEATRSIKACADQMNLRYQRVVFDEWAIVSLVNKKSRILNYLGPRNDDFLKNFAKDLGALRAELAHGKHGIGDFEFARHAVGTLFEAFMVMGEGIYLICNNTTNSMDGITKDPHWLDAQVPFVELSDKLRSHPLVYNL